jgi:hypothetical protein
MTANIAGGASFAFPPVSVPSPPFLDASAQPSAFRKVTLMAAGQDIAGGASTATDWSLAVTITFQPTTTGPAGVFILPAGVLATSTNDLTFVFDTVALPGMSFQITATLAGGAPAASRCSLSYGALVAPSWTDVEPESKL